MTTIIELSFDNSSEQTSNAEWTNTFNPVEIPTGAEIVMRNAFVNTTSQGTVGDLSFPEDVKLTLTFGYYAINDGVGMTPAGYPGADFRLYIARDGQEDNHHLMQNTVHITIEAGKYTPQLLAEIISRKLSQITTVLTDSPVLKCTNPFLLSTDSQITSPGFTNVSTGSNKITGVVVNPLNLKIFAEGKPITITWGTNNTVSTNVFIGLASDGELDIPLAVDIPDSTDVTIYGESPHFNIYAQDDLATFFEYDNNHFIGSTQVAMVYSDEESNRMEWQYLHEPYMANDGTFIVKFLLHNQKWYQIDTLSGIFFTGLKSSSNTDFWFNTLGFNKNILVEDDTTFLLKTPLERAVNITSSFVGLDSIINKTLGSMEVSTTTFQTDVTKSNAIISSKGYSSLANGGYMLIEVSGLQGMYEYEGQDRRNVMGVLSKQWSASGWITGYTDSSVSYINTGPPFLLSQATVRILDPNKLVATDDIGVGSSIFLEVVKPPPAKVKN